MTVFTVDNPAPVREDTVTFTIEADIPTVFILSAWQDDKEVISISDDTKGPGTYTREGTLRSRDYTSGEASVTADVLDAETDYILATIDFMVTDNV